MLCDAAGGETPLSFCLQPNSSIKKEVDEMSRMSEYMLPCTCYVWKINNPKLSGPAVEACNLFFLFLLFFSRGRPDRLIFLHQFSSSLRTFLASIKKKNISVQHIGDVIPDSRSDTRAELFNLVFCVLHWGRSRMDRLRTMQIPPPPSLLPHVTAEVQTVAGAHVADSQRQHLGLSYPDLSSQRRPLQRLEASGQIVPGLTGSCGEERTV